MIKLAELQQQANPGSFLKKLFDGIIKPSSEGAVPEYCPFCGAEKMEFISPLSGRITLLQCECEKKYYMLKDTINSASVGEETMAKIKNEYSRLSELKARNIAQNIAGANKN